MSERRQYCRNCGALLTGEYCSQCGQYEGQQDLTFIGLIGEIADELFKQYAG
ncbi:MAG: hypothetical protein AAF699_10305 [Pseudomonadota bacterium]